MHQHPQNCYRTHEYVYMYTCIYVNSSVRGYLPLIQKDSSTHMHGLAVYVKEGLPFAWDLSLENSADSYLCF